ncbi:hypothetical protein EG329_000073 [Mollisiaceae sp. DMI_Dod_QoI]|nr:hypothetical protein EG329_000073 [Helotiales sp. DMI_Dod_QoI]
MTSKSPGRNFLFGKSERKLRREIPQFLKNEISVKSSAGTPNKVVLVGHKISAELDIMEKIGIDLRDQNFFSIEGILNIPTITKGLGLPFSQPPSLGRVLQYLDIPFENRYLHNAGNDAHFTLRALLMLATIAFGRMDLNDDFRARIKDLKMIALEPIDFDSQTPDAVLLDESAKKAAHRGLGRELATKPADDWWGSSEDESLGTMLFD